MKCCVCGKNADTLTKVLLNADGDFACGQACADKHEADKKQFFASLGDDEAYVAWWAEGGVDVKAGGAGAYRRSHEV